MSHPNFIVITRSDNTHFWVLDQSSQRRVTASILQELGDTARVYINTSCLQAGLCLPAYWNDFLYPSHWPRASASSSPRPSQKLGTSGQQLTERMPRVEARWRRDEMSQSWRVPSRLTWGEWGGTWRLPLGERLQEMTITTWMSS